jgi:hypothetical protein
MCEDARIPVTSQIIDKFAREYDRGVPFMLEKKEFKELRQDDWACLPFVYMDGPYFCPARKIVLFVMDDRVCSEQFIVHCRDASDSKIYFAVTLQKMFALDFFQCWKRLIHGAFSCLYEARNPFVLRKPELRGVDALAGEVVRRCMPDVPGEARPIHWEGAVEIDFTPKGSLRRTLLSISSCPGDPDIMATFRQNSRMVFRMHLRGPASVEETERLGALLAGAVLMWREKTLPINDGEYLF